jgi:hypothetical protein
MTQDCGYRKNSTAIKGFEDKPAGSKWMQDVCCNCVVAIYRVRKLPASCSCSYLCLFLLLRTTPMMAMMIIIIIIMKSWRQTWRHRESYLGFCESNVQSCGILGHVFWVRVTDVLERSSLGQRISSGMLKGEGEGEDVAILRNFGTRTARRNITEERHL